MINPFKKNPPKEELLEKIIEAIDISFEFTKAEKNLANIRLFCHGVLATLAALGVENKTIDYVSKGTAEYCTKIRVDL